MWTWELSVYGWERERDYETMVCDAAVFSCSLYPQIREMWILSHPIHPSYFPSLYFSYYWTLIFKQYRLHLFRRLSLEQGALETLAHILSRFLHKAEIESSLFFGANIWSSGNYSADEQLHETTASILRASYDEYCNVNLEIPSVTCSVIPSVLCP